MSNQIQITGGAKVRALDGVITGTTGVLSSVPYGGANGVATLDSSGKVPLAQLPASVFEYKGTWNATTNTPYLVNGVGTSGWVYVVSVGGLHDFGAGSILFLVGDQVLYDGSIWERSSGATGSVTSVALTAPSAFNVSGSPITTSGTLAITGAGTTSQYINGAGSLTTFPSLTGFVPYTGATNDLNLGTHNLFANNLFDGFTNVAASGSQIVLTIASTPSYTITGSGGQTIKLPDATTLPNGAIFSFNNNQSSGAISINNNSNTLVVSVPSGGFAEVVLLDNSIAAGSWDRHFKAPSNVSWSTNTLDYAGSITSATWNGNVVAINRGGTGSSTQNFVDLTTTQTIGGLKTFSSGIIENGGFIALKQTGSISTLGAGYFTLNSSAVGSTESLIMALGSGFNSTLIFNNAASYTYTFPAASGTISLLESTQTFTGANTFTNTAIFESIGGTGLKYGASISKGFTPFTFSNLAVSIYSDATTNNVIFRDNLSSAKLLFDNSTQTFTFPAATGTLALTSQLTSGTVTSVAALTLGTTGTDLSSTVANSTTTPVITLNVPTASASNRGALASADWTTFNSKQSALSGTGFVKISGTTISYDNSTYYLASNPSGFTSNTGTVTSVGLSSATSGVTIGSSPITTSGTITLAIATATSTQNGLLSSTDWNTFNGKQSALTNPVTGTGFTNYLPKFTGTTTIGNSILQDDGTNVSIGYTTNPSLYKLDVNGTGRFSSNFIVGGGTTTTSKLTILATTGVAAPGSPTLGIYDAANPTYGFDFDLEGVATGDLYLSRLVAGTRTSVLQIARATGAATFSSSVTANTYVEIVGDLRFNSTAADRSIYFRGSTASPDTNWKMGNYLTPTGATVVTAAATVIDVYNGAGYGFMVRNTSNSPLLQIAGNTGAATFSSSVTMDYNFNGSSWFTAKNTNAGSGAAAGLLMTNNGGDLAAISLLSSGNSPANALYIRTLSTNSLVLGTNSGTNLTIASTGAATFSSSVTANGLISINQDQGAFRLYNSAATFIGGIGTGAWVDGTTITDISLYSINNLKFFSGGSSTERMRITSGGNLLVGTTTDDTVNKLQVNGGIIATSTIAAVVPSNVDMLVSNNTGATYTKSCVVASMTATGGTGSYFFYGQQSTSTVAIKIFSNGNIQNTNNSYGAISDARLKENIIDATPKLADLMKVKVRNYNLKGESNKQLGVISQELEEIFPNMIEESTNMGSNVKIKGVKYSVFVPMLIKAVQELKAEIEILKNK